MRYLIGVSCAFLLLIIAPLSNGYSSGINDVNSGCTCHGDGTVSDAAIVTVEGVPLNWSHGESYTVYVNLTGPESSGLNTGGFNLRSSTGTLGSTDMFTQILDGEATHTSEGNDERSWTIQWNAPSKGTVVTFTTHGNAVNGDGIAGSGDHWTKETTSITTSQKAVVVDGPDGFTSGEIATILLGIGFAGVFIITMEQIKSSMDDL